MLGRPTLLAFLGACAALAQPSEFDVATVKLSPPPETDLININLGRVTHGKVTLSNATLSDCIKFAYNLSSDAQLAGPDWIRSGPRFDIVAQAPSDTPRERLLPMVQKLLAERLNLRLHREQRPLSFAALVVAPAGPKVHSVDPEVPLANSPSGPGHIISPRMSMTTLAKLLARFERKPVLDLTGLTGDYEIRLEYVPDNATQTPPAGDAAGRMPDSERPAGLSLYSALQQQLGLKLESRKGPVEVLVVDSADKSPSEN